MSDLSPLAGMPLEEFLCGSTLVTDLSPLKALPLTVLHCYDTPVSDLTPLEGLNLKTFAFTPKNIIRGLEIIRQMESLTGLQFGSNPSNRFPPAEFWKKYDAGDFGKPVAPAPAPEK